MNDSFGGLQTLLDLEGG